MLAYCRVKAPKRCKVISRCTALSPTSLVPDQCACCPDDSTTAAGERLSVGSSASLLQKRCRLELSAWCQQTAAAGQGWRIGHLHRSSSPSCSVPHRLSRLLALWSRRYGPTHENSQVELLGGRISSVHSHPSNPLCNCNMNLFD